jgi:uncharacterized membrane protein
MAALTTLGTVHTAISLVALASGVYTLARDKQFTLAAGASRLYLVTTLLTATTGLGIFQHGGFGPPHVLSLLTLLALAVGWLAAARRPFGAASRWLQLLAFSSTFLFHLIPGFTETLTRLPVGAPVLPSAEAPEFKTIYGVLFLLFGVGLVLQARWLRRQPV